MKSSTYLVQKILFDLFSTQISLASVWATVLKYFTAQILIIQFNSLT